MTLGAEKGDHMTETGQAPIETEEALICEALVREIRVATRWSAIRDAWYALTHVRIMAKSLIAEREKLDVGRRRDA